MATEAKADFHYADLEHQAMSGRLGVWLFIASEVLFFTVLFTIYAWYRTRWSAGFSEAARHGKLVIGTVNTYLLLTSSLCMALAVDGIRRDRRTRVLLLLVLTLLLGLGFLGLKFYEYHLHIEEGAVPGAAYHFDKAPGVGPMLFFTLYYVMTGFHAVHMLVGVTLIGWLLVRTWRGRYSARAHEGIELVGIYWHFVDIVWIFLWPLFYLVR